MWVGAFRHELAGEGRAEVFSPKKVKGTSGSEEGGGGGRLLRYICGSRSELRLVEEGEKTRAMMKQQRSKKTKNKNGRCFGIVRELYQYE